MRRRLLTALATTALLLGGCADASGPAEVDYPQPATLEPVPGTGLNKVTLTQLAATQLGIRTVPVAAPPLANRETVIPLTALVYGPDGNPWTYAKIGDLTYQREAVVIDHITSDTVLLRSGPAVGTPVVTVGGQELLGAEYGVGEE